MQFDRSGESLWIEWTGYDFPAEFNESGIFYTVSWVDLNIEVVRSALASALQRSGTVDGLGAAFRALDTARITQGYAAHIGGEREWSFYNTETSSVDINEVSDETQITWVEIDID